MTFRLVHTADWHLAKPFGTFDGERALRLREARIGAIDRIADVARRTGAAVILVAGDIFDSPGVADEVVRRALAKLQAHAPLVWHLLPGNHDAATAGGIWDRVVRMGVPDNVVVHVAAKVTALSPDVLLLPAPLLTRHTATDPTAWMDGAATAAGVARVGLAHGAVQGFGGTAEATTQLALDRAITANLTYLALGDWHGTREVAQRTWYSGTPEPDRFRDNDPGFVLSVAIESADHAEVGRHRVAGYDWLSRRIAFGTGDPFTAIENEVASLGTRADATLLQLEASGHVSLAEDQALMRRLAALAPRLMYLDARTENLEVDVADDGGDLLDDVMLTEVARGLIARAANAATDHEAAVARHALRRLGEFAGASSTPVSAT